VQHLIPAERLRKGYFRRWFYWRGISRALLYQRAGLDMEAPEQTTLDFSKVPHIAGVPRYLYRRALAHAAAWPGAALRRDARAAFEHETWLCFFAGIVRQRWTDSRHGTSAGRDSSRAIGVEHGPELPQDALHAAAPAGGRHQQPAG
jgi:hypothetical protein